MLHTDMSLTKPKGKAKGLSQQLAKGLCQQLLKCQHALEANIEH